MDGYMKDTINYSARKGRFLWMESKAREEFMTLLKQRIESGYYFSESILAKIVDELAPIMAETVHNE
ncbi:MAG TPA: hypothetical protein VHO70_12145 [Chitinispirillaceae bacterium]|nr:hypothetical protein [Chitinispirillaceae bacterium]